MKSESKFLQSNNIRDATHILTKKILKHCSEDPVSLPGLLCGSWTFLEFQEFLDKMASLISAESWTFVSQIWPSTFASGSSFYDQQVFFQSGHASEVFQRLFYFTQFAITCSRVAGFTGGGQYWFTQMTWSCNHLSMFACGCREPFLRSLPDFDHLGGGGPLWPSLQL